LRSHVESRALFKHRLIVKLKQAENDPCLVKL
jgi:hypothetical protein